jgi:hypothetical protein
MGRPRKNEADKSVSLGVSVPCVIKARGQRLAAAHGLSIHELVEAAIVFLERDLTVAEVDALLAPHIRRRR